MIKNKTLLIISIFGAIYGAIFYPFFTEFIEFGQTLAGKIKIYRFDLFYLTRDIQPTILYLISKFIVKFFDDLYIANLVSSSMISALAFSSIYLFSNKFFPDNKFNFIIPFGLASIFFPNYFLYSLWFPSYFFIWGQLSFYIFIFSYFC